MSEVQFATRPLPEAHLPLLPFPDVVPDAPQGLSGAVQEGRRRSGMSPEELARRVGASGSDVTKLEQGVTVATALARGALAVLGVDPTPYLPGTPHGPVHVPSMDDAHLRAMTYLDDAARVEPGWLLHPDAAAFATFQGYSPEALRSAEERDRASPKPLVRLAAGITGLGALTFLGTVAALATSALDFNAPGLAPYLVMGSAMTTGAGFLGGVMAFERDGPLNAEVLRLRAARAEAERLRDRLVAVSPRGVVTYDVTPDGLLRREYLATAVSAVRVTHHVTGHVRLVIETLVGEVDVGWLPRVRDVLDVVGKWGGRPERLGGKQ